MAARRKRRSSRTNHAVKRKPPQFCHHAATQNESCLSRYRMRTWSQGTKSKVKSLYYPTLRKKRALPQLQYKLTEVTRVIEQNRVKYRNKGKGCLSLC